MNFACFIYSLGMVTGWLSDNDNAEDFALSMADEDGLHIGKAELLRDMLTAAIDVAKAKVAASSHGGIHGDNG